jgi:hypothetical protein
MPSKLPARSISRSRVALGTPHASLQTVTNSPSDPNAQAPDAPGAIPPTGGVPPEDAPPVAGDTARERSASEDLTDGIDLIRRAARKALGSIDPRIEAAAERAVKRLRELDQTATDSFRRNVGGEVIDDVEQLANEVGREIEGFVGRVAERVESVLSKKR